jgi:DNA-binding CsgD family transcriptional regulator/tetratricopeptide (TPR) repeat protein/type II secretory pathway predicted ATPase ExeA
MVGRSETLAALEAALERAPAVVLVAGDAGIGKTRLVREFTAAARATVLWGDCIPMQAGELPYAPFTAALRGVDERGPPTLREPGDARAQRFEAVVSALRRLARGGPVVLVIEDLHWADEATQDLLRFLVRNLEGMPLLALITVRTDEPGVPAPLRRLIAELTRSAERLDLVPLDREQTALQLAGILGTAPDDATVARIHAGAEGNPYFAEELLAAGVRSAPLRSVLLARLADLDADGRRTIELLATIGQGVEHDLLMRVTGGTEPTVRELVDRGALVCDEGRYRFRHALAGEVVYAQLLPSERRAHHAAIARALEAGRPDRAALAHHLHEAGERAPALLASLAAADEAEEIYAFGAARHQLERARALWPLVEPDERPNGVDEAELLRRLAEATQAAGDWEGALPIAEAALALADRGRAAALHRLVADLHHAEAPAVEHLEKALELLGERPSAERAGVMLSINDHRFYGQRPTVTGGRAEAALAVARDAGARAEAGRAHRQLGCSLAYGGDAEAGLAHLEAAKGIAIEVGDGKELGRAVGLFGDALTMLGRVEEGRAAFQAGLDEIRRFGLGLSYGLSIESDIADCELRLGRWEDARARLERLLRQTAHDDHVQLVVAGYLIALEARQGRFEAAAELERTAERLLGANVGPHCVVKASIGRAELALLRGDPDAARAVVRLTCERVGTADLLCGPTLLSLGIRAEAEIAIGRPQEAAAARAGAEELRGAPDRPGTQRWYAFESPTDEWAPPETIANDLLGDAELSRIAAEPRPELWMEAAARFDQVRAPYQAAYARFREAEARLCAHDSTAASPLQSAYAAAVGLAADPLRVAVERLARRARIPCGDGVAPRPFDLTARELAVLELLAVGRTNRAIAGDLFVSPRTVDMHVRNILDKLDAANRVEAAALAHRAGLVGNTAETP